MTWAALRIGAVITATLFTALIAGDLLTNRPDLPLFRRNPLARLFYWPAVIWINGDSVSNWDFFVAFLTNIIVYSFIAYSVIWLVDKLRNKRPDRQR